MPVPGDQLTEYARQQSESGPELSNADLEMDGEEEESPDWEEGEDGSVTVYEGKDDHKYVSKEFGANLAAHLEPDERTAIGQEILELIEKDRQDREPHDKKYAEGIRRSGLGDDGPGGAPFEGASTVTHPILTECAIDFEAAAMKEIMPPQGPVKTKIVGQMTSDKRQKAERKRDFMNHQLTDQVEEYPTELENLLMQLPFSGAQYLSWFYDSKIGRPAVELITSDRVYLPYGASNFYSTPRCTIRMDYTEDEVMELIESGEWEDINYVAPSQLPDRSRSQEAQERVEGVEESGYNEDGLKTFYRIFIWRNFEWDDETDGDYAPYCIIIDGDTGEIPTIYRNWDEGDKLRRKLDHVVEFKFFPWKGPYGIGMAHMIGGLSAAMTGALRALLDTAHINNFPALVKLKSKTGGQSLTLEATGITEIEGTTPVDDVRKLVMPVPFNPPSTVLFQLLGWLDGIAKGVVTTAEEKIADASNNGPVGTTLALIEQGSKVYANIHARLHRSVKKCLQVLHRLNRDHLNDKVTVEELGDLVVFRRDFEGPMDIIPVSDPHIFSESQRYAQLQAVRQLRTQEPDLFNRKALVRRELQQLRVDNYEELLIPDPQQIKANPVAENIMMAKGRPATAFPEQDHLAHIRVLIDFMQDPNLGASSLIAPKFIPLAMQHLAEHVVLWYGMYVYDAMGQMVGPQFEQYLKMDQLSPKVDRVLSLISSEIHQKMSVTMQGVPQVIQQAQQLMAQFSQPTDPNVMEVKRKEKRDQMDISVKGKKLELEGQRSGLKHQVDMARNKVAEKEIDQKDAEVDKKTATEIVRTNKDNQTALTIAKMRDDGKKGQGEVKNGEGGSGVHNYAGGGHVKETPQHVHIDLSSVVHALKSQMPNVDVAPIIDAIKSHNSDLTNIAYAIRRQSEPKPIDFSPVVDAIRSQPHPEPMDLSPVVSAIRESHEHHQRDLDALHDKIHHVASSIPDLAPLAEALSNHSSTVSKAVTNISDRVSHLTDHVSNSMDDLKAQHDKLMKSSTPKEERKKSAKVKIKRDKDNNLVGKVTNSSGKSVRVKMRRDEDNNLVGDIKEEDD